MKTVRLSHDMLRRLACLFLALALVCPLIPGLLPVAAADTVYVARIGDKYYKTVKEAWKAAVSEKLSEIHMMTDWTLDDKLTVPGNITLRLRMHGHAIVRTEVDPKNPSHASDSFGDGSILFVDNYGTLKIFGKDEGDEEQTRWGSLLSNGVWYYDKTGTVPLYGALITGGATDSNYGGAITVDGWGRLEMQNVTVAGNVNDKFGTWNGMGGAILLNEKDSRASLTNCRILYNYAKGEGGGICVASVGSGSLTLKNCDVSDNRTDGNGGGICVSKDTAEVSLSLSGTSICRNRAKNGGGIYVTTQECYISGCTVKSNHASENGGGISIQQENCTLDRCTVTDNSADGKGGGVYVENDNWVYVPKLNISGRIIIRNNTSGKEKSDLYLRNGTALYRDAKINGVPNTDSEIWVRTDTDGIITYVPDSYPEKVFHADVAGKNVYWVTDTASKDYRHLRIGDGKSTAIVLPTVTLDSPVASPGCGKLEKSAYSYKGWPVYKGYSISDSHTETGAYYYSDGYFLDDATKYNEHLATLTIRMAKAAMNSSIGEDIYQGKKEKRGYALQSNHIKQMLSDIGVTDENIFLSDTYFIKPLTDSIACAIGSKPLYNTDGTDSGQVLVPIAVRGAGYESEWTSNVTLGGDSTQDHQGFREAANQVLELLDAYIAEHGLEEKRDQGKLRFWVTGYSRAGATANLVSKTLIDRYQAKGNVIFGYTYEAPQGGVGAQLQAGSDYTTIHNILLAGDLVPHVAMSAMDFQRYGVDHYLPGTPAGTAAKNVVAGTKKGQAIRYIKRYAGSLTVGGAGDLSGNKSSSVFMKDNDYYDTDTAEYAAQREIMLRQLAAATENVTFDDYFHLATISVTGAVGPSFIKETGSGKVTMADWIPDFIYNLTRWMCPEDARTAYVDKDFQKVMRTLMFRMMGNDSLNLDAVVDKLTSFNSIVKIIKWLNANAAAVFGVPGLIYRLGLIPFTMSVSTPYPFYDLLNDCGVFGSDALPLDEDEAKAFSSILLAVLIGDMNSPSDYYSDKDYDLGISSSLTMIGTLLYNANRIKLNHNHQVVYAWLRSYDSYYTDNKDGVSDHCYMIRDAKDSELDVPVMTLKLNGTEITLEDGKPMTLTGVGPETVLSDIRLAPTARNAGGMVFYTEGDLNGQSLSDYQYAQGTLEPNFTVNEKGERVWQVTAHTVWYNTRGENATYTLVIPDAANLHRVYLDDKLIGFRRTGEEVTLKTAVPEGYSLHKWYPGPRTVKAELGEGWDWDWEPADGNVLTFIMPDTDIYWVTEYGPTEGSKDVYYSLNIANGTARDAKGISVIRAKEGDPVTLSAYADIYGRVFDHWDFTFGTPAGANKRLRSVTFRMPAHDVSATAEFAYRITVVSGTAKNLYSETITAAVPGTKVKLTPSRAADGKVFSYWAVEQTQFRGIPKGFYTYENPLPGIGGDNIMIMPDYPVTVIAYYAPDLPLTGDDTQLYLWFGMALAALTGFTVLCVTNRKKRLGKRS